MEYKGGYISLDSMKQLLDGVETTDNLELLREIENSPGDGSEEALTPYGAKCVADEVEELRTALEESERAASLNAHALNLCSDEKLAAWREIEELKRERDEAWGLLLILRDNLKDSVVSGYPVISSHDIQNYVNLIHAHLRDTGE